MRQNGSNSACIIVENETVPFDRRVWQEARALHAAGYKVSVICPKKHGYNSSFEVQEGIEIYRHRIWIASGYWSYFLEYASALVAEFYLAFKIYVRHRFSVLQGCNSPDTIFLIALVFKPLGVRFLFDHHDLSPELYESKFSKRGLIYKILRLLETGTFRTTDMVVATNESYKEIAINRGGIAPERVVVVKTCARLSEAKEIEKKVELKRGKQLLVLYVGIMEIQDGVHLLIEAIGHLIRQNPNLDVHFVLVGNGPELPKLKKLTLEWGVEKIVEFTGLLPHDQVRSYLSTADVCVAPDPLNPLNDKSTMIKILEYMGYGKPIVLFDLKEGRRTVGEGALYARPNDPIDLAAQMTTLLESESLRRQLGECGRRRTEDGLNWESQSAKFLEAYRTLLAAHSL
jgi:glycosyltransferase involved in cell wall biosynthesis